jgi:hypothetical protein
MGGVAKRKHEELTKERRKELALKAGRCKKKMEEADGRTRMMRPQPPAS